MGVGVKHSYIPNDEFKCASRKLRLRVLHLLVLACASLLSGANRASGAEKADSTATLLGGQTFSAELKAIEPNGVVHFATPTGDRVIGRDELVRWGNPVDAVDTRLVLLAEGSEIACLPWSIGGEDEPLHLQNGTLTFAPTLFDPLSVPRHLIRAVVLELPADLTRRDQLLGQIRAHDAKEDAVLVRGGDRLNGRIRAINAQRVSVETSLGPVEVSLASVVAILFESPLVQRPGTSERTLTGLSDGSLVAVREFAAEGGNLVIKLDGGVKLRGGAVENVVSLQPLGGDVAYLSDLEPLRYVHVPYLNLKWPLGRDANVLAGRLRAGGRLHSKGLGVHSAARLVYRLDGTHERFAALAAVDDSADRRGSVVFRVLLAEGSAWREAYTSPVVRGGDEPVSISVSLGNARGLALVVDYADRGDELDHADWLDARLE